MARDVALPGRHEPQRALQEADVPVGLRVGGDLVRAVRPVLPHGVDLGQCPEERQHARRHEEQARGLRGEVRVHRAADDVAVGPPALAPLGVLEVDDQDQVCRDQRDQDARDEQDVQPVQPVDEVRARERAAPQEEAQIRAGERDRHHDGVRGAQTGAGQRVVGQRVAGEALQHRQHEQRHADDPVDFPGPAEGAGEEDAEQVDADGGDEDQCGPVVDLPDQQSAPHVEADAQRGGVRL